MPSNISISYKLLLMDEGVPTHKRKQNVIETTVIKDYVQKDLYNSCDSNFVKAFETIRARMIVKLFSISIGLFNSTARDIARSKRTTASLKGRVVNKS